MTAIRLTDSRFSFASVPNGETRHIVELADGGTLRAGSRCVDGRALPIESTVYRTRRENREKVCKKCIKLAAPGTLESVMDLAEAIDRQDQTAVIEGLVPAADDLLHGSGFAVPDILKNNDLPLISDFVPMPAADVPAWLRESLSIGDAGAAERASGEPGTSTAPLNGAHANGHTNGLPQKRQTIHIKRTQKPEGRLRDPIAVLREHIDRIEENQRTHQRTDGVLSRRVLELEMDVSTLHKRLDEHDDLATKAIYEAGADLMPMLDEMAAETHVFFPDDRTLAAINRFRALFWAAMEHTIDEG